MLDFMGLVDKTHESVEGLSGGLKRLVIARALINQPQIVILDEPTTGLDPAGASTGMAKASALKKPGRYFGIDDSLYGRRRSDFVIVW